MRSRDKIEIHFDAPRVLANLFKQALAESEWSSQAEFFRFHMMQFVYDFKSLKRKRRPPRDKSHSLAGPNACQDGSGATLSTQEHSY